MRKPKSFAEMRAPVATGQLSPDEYQQMVKHAENCPSCHIAQEEFLQFLQKLPADEGDRGNSALLRHIEKGGLRQRFLERMRAEGIQFSDDPEARRDDKHWEVRRLLPPYHWAVAAAVLAAIIIGLSYHAVRLHPWRSLETTTVLPEKRTVTSPSPNNHTLDTQFADLQATIKASRETISKLRVESALMLTRIGALEKEAVARQAEKQALQQTHSRLSGLNAQLANQNEQNARYLAQTKAELEAARVHVTQMEAVIAADRADVGTLSQRLKLQTATADRERELLAAGRDITDLMGARNLHIIDVRDANGIGKNNKAFGRIFYTEGKSLIFYAFDLDERKLVNAKYSFEVWGERLGEPTSVRSLGMLYTDDKDQKRWALKVDDPQQVAEIDSVFVTLESHESGDKPRGQKILFAFLGGKPNHP